MRPLAACLLLTVPLALLPGAPAQACSCSSNYAVPVWPLDGATGVPLDAPLIVATTDLAPLQTQLVADDGTPVPLAERGRLEWGDFSCSNARYLFVAPAQPLAPNRSYHFSATLAGVERPTGKSAELSFVSGTSLRDRTPRDLPLHLFAAQSAGVQRLELFIEWDPSEPIFVAVQGEKFNLVQDIFPGFAEQPAHIPFGAVDCADFTIVDVTGQTLSTPHLCQPSKCSATPSLSSSSCDEDDSATLTWADWQTVSDGCGEPALSAAPALATDTAPVTEVPGAEDADASVAHGGCALQPTRERRAAPPLLVAALALLQRARRRRSAVRGSPLCDSARR
jgi:hypothetical protein